MVYYTHGKKKITKKEKRNKAEPQLSHAVYDYLDGGGCGGHFCACSAPLDHGACQE